MYLSQEDWSWFSGFVKKHPMLQIAHIFQLASRGLCTKRFSILFDFIFIFFLKMDLLSHDPKS